MYERPFERRNEYPPKWTPREQPMYPERREHDYPETRLPEFQRSRDPLMYPQHSYNPTLPVPGGYHPQPMHTNSGYNALRRPDPYSPPSRSFHHADIGRLTQNEAMHNRHHPQETRDIPYGYNVSQESRFASHNERKNGNDWQGEQFQPPPPAVPLESTSYSTGMRYQG